MKKQHLQIRFFIRSRKVNKSGKTPLRIRVTYVSIRKEFSTGIYLSPKHWDKQHQKLLGDSPASEITNTRLSLVKNKIEKAFL